MKTLSLPRMILGLLIFSSGCSAGEERDDANDEEDTDTETDSDTTDPDLDTDAGADDDTDSATETTDQLGCTKMDILFVIDDSGSMGCEQTMLGAAFPGFVEVIDDFNNANANQISYRIGVTSTGRTIKYTEKMPPLPPYTYNEKGMDGELAVVEMGGQEVAWIEGPGDAAAISTAVSELALLGIDGPSYEMPLEAMRMAIERSDTAGDTNEGFLRDDSLFIVVVITDEDDCSRVDNNFDIGAQSCHVAPLKHNLVDLEEYRNFLEDRFGGFDKWVFVAIAGLEECDASNYAVTCSGALSGDGAMEAWRLQDFISFYVNDSPTKNGLFSDICTTDLPSSLDQALEKMEVACNAYSPV